MINIRSSEILSDLPPIDTLAHVASMCLSKGIYYFAANGCIFDLYDYVHYPEESDTQASVKLYKHHSIWNSKRGWVSKEINPIFDGMMHSGQTSYSHLIIKAFDVNMSNKGIIG